MVESTRKEEDLLGSLDIDSEFLYGINTVRALENFPLAKKKINPDLIKAFGVVKLACAQVNRGLGFFGKDNEKADAIEQACNELARGELNNHIVVDALQGGAGTSTNMNVNEVIANKALLLCRKKLGDYNYISPNDDINLHQSTNDTYPTALRLAAIWKLRKLEIEISKLVEEFQNKEKEFSDVLKIARTEMQDAVLITLGREMSAYASAFGRDRWRISKCEERLRQINLGGTAIGTGLSAPRDYIFKVSETLRGLTNIGFARAEDMVENTQNCDVFVEVAGLLKACASNFLKISSDLRLMACLGEITLPAMQAGSSIMPDKINPVIPEAVSQAAMRVFGHDHEIAIASSSGNLELNAFMPIIADALLDSLDLLINSAEILRVKCVVGIKANKAKCILNIEGSTAVATALLSKLGYTKAAYIARIAKERGKTVKEIAIAEGFVTETEYNELLTPEAVLRLGTPDNKDRK